MATQQPEINDEETRGPLPLEGLMTAWLTGVSLSLPSRLRQPGPEPSLCRVCVNKTAGWEGNACQDFFFFNLFILSIYLVAPGLRCGSQAP